MKKRNLTLILLSLLLVACGNKTRPSDFGFTLSVAMRAFYDEGADINEDQRPLYELVNARDGAIFYLENELVRIYEFEDESAYEKGVEELTILGTFPKRELLVIETQSQRAIEIFETTGKEEASNEESINADETSIEQTGSEAKDESEKETDA